MEPEVLSGANDSPDPSTRAIIVNVLEYAYGPILVGLLFAYVFVTQDPAQEVILGLARELEMPTLRETWNWVFGSEAPTPDALDRNLVRLRNSIGSVLLWSVPVTVWSASYFAVRHQPPARFRAARWIPILAGVGVFLALAYGIRLAANSAEGQQLDPLQFRLLYARGAAGLLAGAVLHFSIRLMGGLSVAEGKLPDLGEVFGAILVLLLFVVPIFLLGFLSPEFAGLVGPVGVSAAFAITAAYVLAGLTILSGHAPGHFPLLLVVILMGSASTSWSMAILLCALTGLLVALRIFCFLWAGAVRLWPGLTNLRLIRWLSRLPAPVWWSPRRPLAYVQVAAVCVLFGFFLFAALASRQPPPCGTLAGCNLLSGTTPTARHGTSAVGYYDSWTGRSRPTIRIIAAQGGGLYAAYHTAYYLAARADLDADFAESIYAISGVSGGSVGAGVFWAIRASGLCDGKTREAACHQNAVKRILRHDYLSPALAAFFFRDTLDSVFPISYFSDIPIDRSRVLENVLSDRVEAWADAQIAQGATPREYTDLPRPYLETALGDSWAADKGLPLLMLNATQVGAGTLRILSPLPFIDVPPSTGQRGGASNPVEDPVAARLGLEGARDLSVGDAMVTSARFPLVTPPARVRVPNAMGRFETLQLVDGGYFDNSGIEAIFELTSGLAERHSGEIEVIIFSVQEGVEPIEIKGTIGAPLSAFTGAWRARRSLTTKRFNDAVNANGNSANSGPNSDIGLCAARLFQKQSNFTVSWFLTKETFDDIERQIESEVLPTKLAPDLCPRI